MTDRDLIEAALKFFVWGAGQGISPPLNEAPEPEETLYGHALETGEDDYDVDDDAFVDRIVARLPRECSFARIAESSDGQAVLLYVMPYDEATTLHQVVVLPELAVDLKIDGIPDEVDLNAVDQETIDSLVDTVRGLVE